MKLPETAIMFGTVGLLATAWALFQLRTGKTLLFGEWVSREQFGGIYRKQLRGAVFASLLGVGLAIWMIVLANPAPVDPSAQVVQGADLVVHGGGSAR